MGHDYVGVVEEVGSADTQLSAISVEEVYAEGTAR